MSAPWRERLGEDPRLPLIAALVGVALAAPALFAGLVGDDWFHRAILLGVDEVAGLDPLRDLFRFLDGGPFNERMMASGMIPWWGDPDAEIGFFRPVSALTHLLDYALWPDAIGLHHLHSLLWYGLGVALAARLYRRVHPGAPAVAGLAALLFAVEDAHALPAGWLANRNAAIALALGVGALLAHLRWRAAGGARWLAAALGLLAAALLAGEAALGAAAYIAAFQLAREGGPLARRLAPLLPYGALILAWRLAYDALGYGASGSGLYIDPGREPLEFAAALAQRWPTLLAGQWLQLPVDLWPLLPGAGRLALVALGAAAAAGLAALLWPLRGVPEARAWALGSCLALVPLCGAFPMDRLLLFAGLGACPLLALLAAQAASGLRSLVTRLLLVLHGPVAALMLLARAATLPLFGALFAVGAAQAPAGPEAADQTFVFVQGQIFASAYTGVVRQLGGAPGPAPRRVALLSSSFNAATLERLDERTLRLALDEHALAHPVDSLFRDPAAPFAAGQRIDLPDFTAEIEAVNAEGQATAVRFTFREPLEDPQYRWLTMTDLGVDPWPLPAVGEARRLEPVDLAALAR